MVVTALLLCTADLYHFDKNINKREFIEYLSRRKSVYLYLYLDII